MLDGNHNKESHQGNVNMLNQPMTSQPQTVMLGNQIVKVQSLSQMQQKINSQVNVSGTNTGQDGQRPIILGSTIKVLKVVFFYFNVHEDGF